MGLAEYIAHLLEKFYAMVQEAFADVSANSTEAQLLTKAEADGMVRYVDDLQKLWDDALVDAVENGRTNRDSGDVEMKHSRWEYLDKRSKMRWTVNNHPMELWFDDEALMGALDEGGDGKPTELELMAQDLQAKVLAKQNDIVALTAANEDGENKIAIVEKRGKMSYAIVDVYRLDTTEYDGRIADILKKFERGIVNYGKQEFHRWFESSCGTYGKAFFAWYDRRNSRFDEIRPDAGGKGRENVGADGQGDNGRGTAGGGAKSPWGLKSDFPERLRYLWPSYKEMVRDHKYWPKKVKNGQYALLILNGYLFVQKKLENGQFKVSDVYDKNDLAVRNPYRFGTIYDDFVNELDEREFFKRTDIQEWLEGATDYYKEPYLTRVSSYDGEMYQARDYTALSEREILAGADPNAFKNAGSREYLKRYQAALREREKLQDKLTGYQEEALKEGISRADREVAEARAKIAETQLARQEEQLSKLEGERLPLGASITYFNTIMGIKKARLQHAVWLLNIF